VQTWKKVEMEMEERDIACGVLAVEEKRGETVDKREWWRSYRTGSETGPTLKVMGGPAKALCKSWFWSRRCE
jgi:hypothetical protein